MEPLSPENATQLLEPCVSCARWELGDELADSLVPPGLVDPALEKEAWLTELFDVGADVGRLARARDGSVVAHLVLVPPTAAGRRLPTSPVSPDALLLVSMAVAVTHRGMGLGRALVGEAAVLAHTVGRRAVEAFAGSDGPDVSLPSCLMSRSVLEHLGFSVVASHPSVPRLRLDAGTVGREATAVRRPSEAAASRARSRALTGSIADRGRSVEQVPTSAASPRL